MKRKQNNWLFINKDTLGVTVYGSLQQLVNEHSVIINGHELDYNQVYYSLKKNGFKFEWSDFIIEKKEVKILHRK